jgi:hypothetical protein
VKCDERDSIFCFFLDQDSSNRRRKRSNNNNHNNNNNIALGSVAYCSRINF